mgnify:CR=1 FL=1
MLQKVGTRRFDYAAKCHKYAAKQKANDDSMRKLINFLQVGMIKERHSILLYKMGQHFLDVHYRSGAKLYQEEWISIHINQLKFSIVQY